MGKLRSTNAWGKLGFFIAVLIIAVLFIWKIAESDFSGEFSFRYMYNSKGERMSVIGTIVAYAFCWHVLSLLSGCIITVIVGCVVGFVHLIVRGDLDSKDLDCGGILCYTSILGTGITSLILTILHISGLFTITAF